MMKKLYSVIVVLRQRFDVLPANDRRALLFMFGAISVALIYFSVTLTHSYQQAGISRYKETYENFRWITVNMPQLKQMAGAESNANKAQDPALQTAIAGAGGSLINIATTTAKPFGITFKRFQPEGDNGLRLWLESAEFDKLLRWVAMLESQNIALDQLDVDRLEKQQGMVDARILISISP
jgi:general secretion pathway protein M